MDSYRYNYEDVAVVHLSDESEKLSGYLTRERVFASRKNDDKFRDAF